VGAGGHRCRSGPVVLVVPGVGHVVVERGAVGGQVCRVDVVAEEGHVVGDGAGGTRLPGPPVPVGFEPLGVDEFVHPPEGPHRLVQDVGVLVVRGTWRGPAHGHALGAAIGLDDVVVGY